MRIGTESEEEIGLKEQEQKTLERYGLHSLLKEHPTSPVVIEKYFDIISMLEKEAEAWKGKLEDSLSLVQERAYELAKEYHQGQVDKMQVHYICHIEAVADGVDTIEQKIVALLHDILEDTACTREILFAEGIPAYLIDSVESMTRRSGESYQAFIERVAEDDIARLVKLSDLAHNYDADGSRLQSAYKYHEFAGLEVPITEKTDSLKKRYERAIAYLENVEHQRQTMEP